MKKREGFTLIEIMISVAMLTAGFLAILYMFPLGAKIEKLSQMTTTALELGQAEIEEINSKSYNEILSSTKEYGTMTNFLTFKIVTASDFYNPETGEIAENDTGIKKITVTVFWHSSLAGEENIALNTLIARK